MKEDIRYILYQTTNKTNGKIYVGIHRTYNINDGYIGSGKSLTKAIKKYGKKNFERIILKECSSVEDLYKNEAEVVNNSFVARSDTYNLVNGGCGPPTPGMKGKHHSIKTRKKMSKCGKGTLNSNYGKHWISNISIMKSKCISRCKPIPDGWVKGRNVWKKIEQIKKRDIKQKIKIEQQADNIIKELRSLYALYTLGGFDAVVDYGYSYSKSNLIMRFKRYLPEYSCKKGNQSDTIWIYNITSKQAKRINKNDNILPGWRLGRMKCK